MLSAVINAMLGKKIVVIGDVMLDRFINGRVDRISPEAPVPVLSYQNQTIVPGGAANVALNLARFGVNVSLIGVAGMDEDAQLLEQKLAEEPQISLKLLKDARRITTQKTRFSSAGQQILRLDHEDAAPLSQGLYKRMIAAAATAIKNADLVIISDYKKGVIDHSLIKHVQAMAKEAGGRHASIPVIADPKNIDPSLYQGCDLITPNLNELRHMSGLPLSTQPEIITAAKEIARRYKIKNILVTLGADGMVLVDSKPKSVAHHIKSQAQSVFDVSGAGDTVIATIAAAIAAMQGQDDDLVMAMEIANKAAGLVVGKSGTATVLPGEILAKAAPAYTPSERDVLGMVKLWRDAGMRIGFTNGCFDLLHPGHLWVLEQAAATCDRLVVGLNSDQSTRRLKGDGRPHQNQDDRAAALASLPSVDAVVVFDAPTPAKLIKAISPDRLIKGGDYKANEIVGADHVKAHGGKVVIVKTKPGFSTTRLSSS